jgi:hypothetical protein
MCGTIGMIKVYDLNTGNQVLDFFIVLIFNELESNNLVACIFQIHEFAEPNGWTVISVCFGYHGLAVSFSSNRRGCGCQLTFWRIDHSCESTYLGHLPLPIEGKFDYNFGMDENFVVVFQRGTVSRIFIVSTKTRKIVETITDSSIQFVMYGQGLLIIQYPSCIR